MVVQGNVCAGVVVRVGLGLVVREIADPAELAILGVLRSGNCVDASSAFAYQAEVVSYVALSACLTVGWVLFAADTSRSLGAVTMFSTVHACIAWVRGFIFCIL